jgi:processive 1,2-diacylglycerol beta-glucosyltransferase
MEQHSVGKTILFLPFLQIPSGHHQVANALMEAIQKNYPAIKCDKVDILSYSYGKIEALVSSTYLKWIRNFPEIYSLIYRSSVCKNIEKAKRYRLYEVLFISFMKRLLKEKQPDLIVCTHALPSYMLNCLKRKGELQTPVINAYTDYFIHSFWGTEHIDFHFVPSDQIKELLKKRGVKDEQIFITGIPIHEKIEKQVGEHANVSSPTSLSVLVTGGNLGVGALEDLVKKIEQNKNIHFYVLCGKNEKLYKKLETLQNDHITPLSYITSREKMNKLYDQIHAIITKPGGVTISESLFKRKPIFVYCKLPGQEEINFQQLKQSGLIMDLNDGIHEKKTIEEQLYSFFQNENQIQLYQDCLSEYHHHIIEKEPYQIIEELLMKGLK